MHNTCILYFVKTYHTFRYAISSLCTRNNSNDLTYCWVKLFYLSHDTHVSASIPSPSSLIFASTAESNFLFFWIVYSYMNISTTNAVTMLKVNSSVIAPAGRMQINLIDFFFSLSLSRFFQLI